MREHVNNIDTSPRNTGSAEPLFNEYAQFLIDDFSTDRRTQVDAIIEAVYQAENPSVITLDDIQATHKLMMKLLRGNPTKWIQPDLSTLDTVALAKQALLTTLQHQPAQA